MAVFSRSLDRARLGEYTLVMKSHDPLMMCYIFKGQAFTGIQKVNQFIETTIESKSNWNALLRTAQSGFTLNESEYGTLEKITDDVFLSKDNRLSS